MIVSSSVGSFWKSLECLKRYEDELGISLQDFWLVILRRMIFEEYEVMPGVFCAMIANAKGLLRVMNEAFRGMLNDVALSFSEQDLTRFATQSYPAFVTDSTVDH